MFRELGLPDPDTEQMKSALAAEILKAIREQKLTHAAAAERARVQRADISRASARLTSTALRSTVWCAS